MKDMLFEMGQVVLDSGKIWAGLAILEDGYDQTAELHALRPDEILTREPQLLARHREYFPRLPLDDINVLVVDAIGKTYSGTGMDTNVIGYRGVRDGEDLTKPANPRDRRPVARRGLPRQRDRRGPGRLHHPPPPRRDRRTKDIPQRLHHRPHGTGQNPRHVRDDEELVATIARRYGNEGWLFIPNTLHLDTLYASEDLAEELAANPMCAMEPTPIALQFKAAGIASVSTAHSRRPFTAVSLRY